MMGCLSWRYPDSDPEGEAGWGVRGPERKAIASAICICICGIALPFGLAIPTTLQSPSLSLSPSPPARISPPPTRLSLTRAALPFRTPRFAACLSACQPARWLTRESMNIW